jgi:TonB family protein
MDDPNQLTKQVPSSGCCRIAHDLGKRSKVLPGRFEASLLLCARGLLNLRPIVIVALIVSGLAVGLFRTIAFAQENQQTHQREVLQRAEPAYPDIARRTQLKGVVRLRVKVAADGSITSTEVLGGNPVFVKAALGAIEKWRWARASGETAEVVRLAFGGL